MIPLWYGHVQRRTSGLPTTPQRATPQHQVYDGSRRRRQDPVPWCWHFKKPWRLLASQRLQETQETDRYLNQRSFHHPSIKSSVNHTLVHDPVSLPKELRNIKTTLQRNGYKPSEMKTSKPVPNTDKVSLPTSLPYLGCTSHKLQRILQQASIQVYHSAPNNLQWLLHTRNYYYYYYYYWCKLDIRGKVHICNVQPITRQYTIYYIRTQVTYKTYGRTQVKYKVYRARDPKDTQSTWKKEWTRNNIKAI